MPKDDEIRLAAAIEAQTVSARRMGAMAAAFFNEVTKGGVSAAESMSLTGSYLSSVISGEVLGPEDR